MFQSIELFTGAGGLALATHMAGFENRGLFEWNSDACDTLRENAAAEAIPGLNAWSGKIHQGDVRGVSFKEFAGINLVAGGPPCQPFSLGGKHGGMEDQRDMIPQFIRAVREAHPQAFIMENVRGLARSSFATYLDYTKLQLTYPELVRRPKEGWERHLGRLQRHHTSSPKSGGLNYNVVFAEVRNAADYGVPQVRERIFIVGFRSDVDARWEFPKATHSRARLFHDQWISGDYWKRMGCKKPPTPPAVATQISQMRIGEAPDSNAWRTIREAVRDLPKPFRNRDDENGVLNHRFQPGARPYPGHTGSPIDLPSKTLKAGGHGVPGGENMLVNPDGTCRYLTIREAARVQSFPDHWHFKGAWGEAMRQLGNAVPVDLASVVTKSVATSLAQHSKHARSV